MTRGNIQGFCFNEIMLLKKLAFQYRTQKLLSGDRLCWVCRVPTDPVLTRLTGLPCP